MADSGTREFGVATQSKKLHIRTTLPPITDFAMSMHFHHKTTFISTYIIYRSYQAERMGRRDYMS